MHKVAGSVIKGVGAGMAAGIAVGVVGTLLKSGGGKHMKRNGRKAIHAVEEVLDQALYMMK